MNKEIIKLIKIVENQIVSILLVHGYIELIDTTGPYKFSNIRVSIKGEDALDKHYLVTDSQVQEYRLLWPIGYRGSNKLVKEKMERFILENECTFEQIMLAAKKYLKVWDTPYHGKAQFFFYKIENGEEISRAEEYLDDINVPVVKDYRNEVL